MKRLASGEFVEILAADRVCRIRSRNDISGALAYLQYDAWVNILR
jgi:hypothetical protein